MEPATNVEWVTFMICAAISLLGAFGVVLSRNPVHAALSLVATLFAMAVLFLNLGAEFLAVVQVIVYTGAIVILILFVLMLLGVDEDEDVDTEPLRGQRPAAIGSGVLIAAAVFAAIQIRGGDLVTGTREASTAIVDGASNIEQVGRLLFTDYVFSFQLAAVLLTVAVVGAVVLARRPSSYEPLPEPEPMDPPDPLRARATTDAEEAS